MSFTGRAFSKQYEATLKEQRDQQPVLYLCNACPWTHSGTLAAGREAHQKHRLKKHPELKATPRKRHAIGNTMVSKSDITENIANVRSQGGHRWGKGAR